MMIPFAKLGLASSVAKAQNFSWLKTVELAGQFKFRQIQLYLNPSFLDENHAQLLLQTSARFRVHLHLPPCVNEPKIQLFLERYLKELKTPIFLIQHQTHWKTTDLFPLQTDLAINGLENDAPRKTPKAFLDFFLERAQKEPRLIPVLDVSRFFVQAPPYLPFDEVQKQVIAIFLKLQELNQPFIIHAIDHPARQFKHQFWKPLLEGDLPWSKIIKIVNLRLDLLKCFMFEYENWSKVRKSIDNLMPKKTETVW